MAIQIAHMSDLHFCPKNLQESNKTFGFAVDDAIKRNVRAAVVTGDSTDHAIDAHSPALRALAGHLKRLADHCPVLLLQGTFSHEPPGLLRMFEMIGAKHPIAIAEQISMFGLNSTGFEPFEASQTYEMVVTAFPTVNKADLVAYAGSIGGASDMGDMLFSLIQSFAPINTSLRKQGIPTMFIGHGTVQSCETEHGVPMAGADHEFGSGALFAAECDVVALGHIHKTQEWVREKMVERPMRQIIAYAGSIGRFHYGEEGDKHYLVWNMEASNPSYEAVVTPSRRTVDIFFDGPPDMTVIQAAVQQCAGAYVRVRYCVDEEHKQLINREAIRAVLGDACEVQIEGKNLIVERQRAAGISTEANLTDKLRTWCTLTNSEPNPLVERLASLETLAPQEIAASIMQKIKNGTSNEKAAITTQPVDGVGDNLVEPSLDKPSVGIQETVRPAEPELPEAPKSGDSPEFDWLHSDDGLFA